MRLEPGFLRARRYFVSAGFLLLPLASASSQVFFRMGGPGGGGDVTADASFKPHVAHPAFTSTHPRVLLDEAHAETNTKAGAYAPFADLLAADGCVVVPSLAFFADDVLQGASVLVIPTARGGDDPASIDRPAFRPDEVEAVARWVEQGGSLLLVGDASPFSSPMQNLAKRLGVDMPGGVTMDSVDYDKQGTDRGVLVFSDDNKLLGDHPIIRGRDATERVHRVVVFGGQSLVGPAGASALLRLGDQAWDVPPRSAAAMQAEARAAMAKAEAEGGRVMIQMKPPAGKSAAGRTHGIAFELGKGRVVVLGDAAMLSAQISQPPMGGEPRKLGMNVAGNDDQQFALNVMRWLARAL